MSMSVVEPYTNFRINRLSKMTCLICHDDIHTWDKIDPNEIKRIKRSHRKECK